MTPGKALALIICTFVSKVMSLLFNMLFRFIKAFLAKSKHLLISCLQSLSTVISGSKKRKSVFVSIFSLLFAVKWSKVVQSCPTFCNPMDCSTPSFSVHHQLLEFTQTHIHRVGDAIQPSHPLSSTSPAFNLSQYHGLFQWVSSSHQVAKVLEF